MLSKMDITELVSFYVLNLCMGQDLIDFACKTLESDINSKALLDLASAIEPSMSVVGPLFESLLHELKITKPTKLKAQLTIAHYYARSIINGSLSAYEGACKIWWNVSNEIEHPADILLAFVGAASEIEDLPERYEGSSYDPMPIIEEYEKQIIDAAGKLLKIKDPSKLCSPK